MGGRLEHLAKQGDAEAIKALARLDLRRSAGGPARPEKPLAMTCRGGGSGGRRGLVAVMVPEFMGMGEGMALALLLSQGATGTGMVGNSSEQNQEALT